MTSPTPPQDLLRAARLVLKPLVKLLLAGGVTFPQLAELMRGLYVEVAESDFRLRDKAQTDSRISLLTGIHRKDIKRLREMPPSEAEAAAKSTPLSAQVLAAWLGRRGYQDAQGQPLTLPRQAASDEPAFDELVASISKDIRPRALLDEWLRLGMVHAEGDLLTLNTDAFIPHADQADKLFYFSHNLADHAATASENLLGEKAPRLERSVHRNGLSAARVARLAAHADQRGMALLRELNALAQAEGDDDLTDDAQHRRFTFGIYFHDAEEDASS